MTKQIVYKVTLKSLGRITQLPDSQRLFGALIYRYSEKNQATELVQKIFNKDLDFMLSNVLPKDYLPVPQAFFNDKVTGKESYKKIKKRAFLKKDQLMELMEVQGESPQNPEACELFPYVALEDSQQIHASIDSLRYDLPWLKSNLYSVPEITVVEHKSKESRNVINEFQFYISGKVGSEMENLKSCLEDSRDNNQLLTLGPRSSQGLNLYQIEDIKDIKGFADITTSNELYLNIGMLLPNRLDFENSYLKLFTSERRPFRSYGERNSETPKQLISFIEAGSLINVNKGQKLAEIGQSVRSPFDSEGKEIVFGQAFLYPLVETKEA